MNRKELLLDPSRMLLLFRFSLSCLPMSESYPPAL